MLDTLQNQTSAKLTLDCRLPTLVWMCKCRHLLQIIREAVLNAMKHANASEIAVSCVTAPDGNHTVYIRDNGIGIGEPKEPGRPLWSEYHARTRGKIGWDADFFTTFWRRYVSEWASFALRRVRKVS